MNIGFLTGSVSRLSGGLLPAVSSLARNLAELDIARVSVLALEDGFTQADSASWGPVQVRAFDVVGPRSFGYSPALLDALLKSDFHVVHAHGIWMYPSCAGRRWQKVTKGPLVMTTQGMLDELPLKSAAWKKRVAGWLYQNEQLRSAACFHAVSECEARSLRRYGLRNPICILPNGMDLPKESGDLSPDWENAETRGAKVLLYLGRLHPIKNLFNLLGAWAKVRRESAAARDWRLVVAGWEQKGHKNQLEKAARELQIVNTIQFVGPQFGMAKDATLRRADAFILPSFSEGLPSAVLEAWAYGIPAVLTPHCNLPQGFAAHAAIRCDTSAASIAAALDELFHLSDFARREAGARGRRLIEEQFMWREIAAQMKQVYEWLSEGGPRPDCVVTT